MTDEVDNETAMLIHGTIGPNKTPHAWIEFEDNSFPEMNDPGSVWEPTSDEVYPRPVFNALFYAIVHNTYDYISFRKLTLKTEHWGPWEGDYWQLTGRAVAASKGDGK